MNYSRPFITERFIAYAADSFGHRLSLAVGVADEFTQDPVAAPLRVALKELPRVAAIKSLSGFFCFEDVVDGTYTLVVEPDAHQAPWFFLRPREGEPWSDSFERSIVLPLQTSPPTLPLEPVALAPNPSYPFPKNATLVRGLLISSISGEGLPGAVVSSTYNEVDPTDPDETVAVEVEIITDKCGEFVLFFRKLPARTQTIVITATKNGDQVQDEIEILEGATTNLTLPPLP